MAQINVQPKRKNYWWLWLLLIVIAGGVIYYLNKNHMLPGSNPTTGNPTASDSSVYNDTARDGAATDSALHSHNGITGQ